MPLNEYDFPSSKVANVQSQLEKLVEKNYYLHQSAKDAYRGYILAYNSHQLKDIFNVHMLDLQAVAKSFGFTGPPRVSIHGTRPSIGPRSCRSATARVCRRTKARCNSKPALLKGLKRCAGQSTSCVPFLCEEHPWDLHSCLIQDSNYWPELNQPQKAEQATTVLQAGIWN